MKTWFTSLNGAITLTAIALLGFIGYIFLVSRYFLEKWIPGTGATAVETIGVLLIIGGWLRSLFAAREGKRGGLIAALAFSVLTALITLYDLIPPPFPYPVFLITVAATFVFSVIAIAALVSQLQRSKAAG